MLHRSLCEPQDQSGRGRKMLPQQEFDRRTIQLVASRYTVSQQCFKTHEDLINRVYFKFDGWNCQKYTNLK
jgi:hypothetical protein